MGYEVIYFTYVIVYLLTFKETVSYSVSAFAFVFASEKFGVLLYVSTIACVCRHDLLPKAHLHPGLLLLQRLDELLLLLDLLLQSPRLLEKGRLPRFSRPEEGY